MPDQVGHDEHLSPKSQAQRLAFLLFMQVIRRVFGELNGLRFQIDFFTEPKRHFP
jgi:hypothetical protein